MTPRVSFLIPCYNAAPWIAAALDSVFAQTWPNIEVIVVDDGSRDESALIAERYVDRGLRLIGQANRGQAAAFNEAWRHATGDYFVFFDADDIMAPDKTAVQMTRLAQLEPGWIASCAWARFRDDIAEARFLPEPVWRDLAAVDWLVESWMGGGMMHGAAWLIPRSVADQAGPWDESLSLINDLDFFPRVLLASRGVAFCPEARTYYRSGAGASLSGQRSPAACASAFRAMRNSREALLRAEDSPRTRLACATTLQRFLYWVYPDGREYIAETEAEVRRLGGTAVRPTGGRLFQLISKIAGWKRARRLELWQTRQK